MKNIAAISYLILSIICLFGFTLKQDDTLLMMACYF